MFNYFLYSQINERAESSRPCTLAGGWRRGGTGPTVALVLSLPESIGVWRGNL